MITPCLTIQGAVTKASGGDTIHVAAGTYGAGANLNKSLTLLGAQAGVDARDGRPAASETIVSAGGLGTFFLNATDITIDGFKFTNMAHRTIDTYFDADNFTMRNCILQGTQGNSSGGAIQFGGPDTLHANGLLFEQNLVLVDGGPLLYLGHAADDGTIRNNLFNGGDFMFGPFGNRTGWLIEGNEFDGNVAGHGAYWGFGINANLGDVTIQNNYVHEMLVGIGQISVVGGTIVGNTFDDNSYAAFQLWGGEWGSVVSSNVLIENNLIKYNGQVPSDSTFGTAAHGIRLRPAPDATTIHMHKNAFIDLGVGAPGLAWAIRQQGTGTADAETNWWGTTDGSVIATMIGQGPADYDPWIVTYVDDPTPPYPNGFWPTNITYPPCTTDCYVDAATGSDTNPGTLAMPFLTIQKAVSTVSASGTVHVAAGTYVEAGQIVIGKSMTIDGEGCGTTIIKTNQDTGTSGDPRGWWLVNAGSVFNLTDLTLDGSGYKVYQGIRIKGSGTIDSVCFTQIKYNPSSTYQGVAVAAMGDGPVDISDSFYDNIGRIGTIYFGSSVNGSVYDGNTYTGKGDGDWLDYGVELGGGAQVTISNSAISNNTGEASSDGSVSAGILATTYFGAGTSGTITGNTLTGNTEGIAVGYDASDTSNVVAYDNCIFSNTSHGISSTGPSVDAENNWWGDSTGPYHASKNAGGLGNAVSDNIDFEPWITDGCHGTITTGHWKNLRTNAFDDLGGSMSVALTGDTIQGVCTGSTPIPGGGIATVPGVTTDLHGCVVGPGSSALVINADDVTVMGPGVFDGEGDSEPAILVNAGADNFILDGVEIKGWSDGVQVAGAVESLKIVNNWIHSNTDDGLQVDAAPTGVVTIEGNLFKVNGDVGVEYGGTGSLDATYNSWGDDAGPTGTNGDGVGAGVLFDPWTFSEIYIDMDPSTTGLQTELRVAETESFDIAVLGDAENLYGLSFIFSYDDTNLTYNSVSFSSPWGTGPAENCMVMTGLPGGQVGYYCGLVSGSEWDGGTIATFNFTADGSSAASFFDIFTDETLSSGAVGGVKVFVNNAGYNDPSVAERDITDTDDGRLIIDDIANFTGFIDLQGRPNDSGALLDVWSTSIGGTKLATASSASSGKYTTVYESGKLMVVSVLPSYDVPYFVSVDRSLYLPASYISKHLYTSPTTLLLQLQLLGGDGTDDDMIDINDASLIGAAYGNTGVVCGPSACVDVNGDGVVNIYDLTLMGGNYTKTYSPWSPE